MLFAAEQETAPGEVRLSAEASLNELAELLATAGGETVGMVIQRREALHPKTYLGSGKIEELKTLIADTGADGAICDDELTPAQLRELNELIDVKVLDRTLLILDIFTQRATTREGKLQVELAQLNYRLTRLTGLGTELSRQGGSTGAAKTRGAGESKLELDRRYIRRRIDRLNAELKEIEARRELLRRDRSKNEIPVVALVGYTNAGKSTLFNRMTGAGVLEEDKLFATLSTTVRRIALPTGREVLLSDTVGFIHKLPHHLVKAFKATLEETAYADVLLHVIDNSDEDAPMQARVTYDTLQELKAADKPIIAVLNKEDLREKDQPVCAISYKAESILRVSAFDETTPERIMAAVEAVLAADEEELSLLIPYSAGRLLDELHRGAGILSEEYEEGGVRVTLRVGGRLKEAVKEYQL